MRRRSKKGRFGPISDEFQDLIEETTRPVRPASPVALRPPSKLRGQQDRRRWVPDPFRIEDAQGRTARIGIIKKASAKPREQVAAKRMRPVVRLAVKFRESSFTAPRQITACLRRHARREVLFALRRTKSGSGSPKKRTWLSNIRC